VGLYGQTHNLILIPNPADTNGGRVSWRERRANGTHEFRLIAPPELAADINMVLPQTDGGPFWSLSTDGGGNFEFREMLWADDYTGGTHQLIKSNKEVFDKNWRFSRATRGTAQNIEFQNRGSALNGNWTFGMVAGVQSALCANYTNGGLVQCFEEFQVRTFFPSRFDGAISTYATTDFNALVTMAGNPVIDTSRNITGMDVLALGALTVNTYIDMPIGPAPVPPSPGYGRAYFKDSVDTWCAQDSTGTEKCLGAGGAPSLELPVSFTLAGVDRGRIYNSGGNTSLYLRNSSDLFGAQLVNFLGGSELQLQDTNGDGKAKLFTGDTTGAGLELEAADTIRVGIRMRGGPFTGDGGSIQTRNYLNQVINTIDWTGILTTSMRASSITLSAPLAGAMTLALPAISSTFTLTLPGSTGSAGQCWVLSSAAVFAFQECITTGASTQTKSGALNLTAGGTWGTYGELQPNYTGSGNPGIVIKSNTGTAHPTLVAHGGNSTAQATLQLLRHTGAVGWDVAVSPSGQPLMRMFNASGTQTLGIDGSGSGLAVTSSGNEIAFTQTGDSVGDTVVRIRNRTHENGVVVENLSENLADVVFKGNSGVVRSIRMDARTSFNYLESSTPEFQFGDMPNSPGGIGLLANANGAGVYKGDYFRWLGATSGYVGIKAPSTVTSYTWTLPAADSAGPVCSDGAGNLSIGSCSGSSSILTTTVFIRNGSGNDVHRFGTLGGQRGYSYVFNTSGNPGIQMDGGNPSSSLPPGIQFYGNFGNMMDLWSGGLQFLVDGAGTESARLWINGSTAGELYLRDSGGTIRAQINQNGYQWSGNTGQTTTVSVSGCTMTFNGGILTAKSGC